MSDELKSAFELAMEKLDAGEDRVAPLSDEQKERIAGIRSRYQARIAQEEIQLQSEIRTHLEAGDAAGLRAATEKLNSEKKRLTDKMEREVAKVHAEAATDE